MAEAEEVIAEAARHATNFAQALWRRHVHETRPGVLLLAEVAPRLDLLLRAVTGRAFVLRVAQPPAPATALTRLFRRAQGPRWREALPATDDRAIWLPQSFAASTAETAIERFRTLALLQAMRALRGSARGWPGRTDPLTGDLYLLCEAMAADQDLVSALPGMTESLNALHASALAQRPPFSAFSPPLRALEEVVRGEALTRAERVPSTASDSLARARQLAAQLRASYPRHDFGSHPLYRDVWLGELHTPSDETEQAPLADSVRTEPTGATRSVRLPRRPKVREADREEDDSKAGMWMVQNSQPNEQVEDPHGLQRPADRDDATAAEELADALSELPEARLVSNASRPLEVLLSDDPPERRAKLPQAAATRGEGQLSYPEWDYRSANYVPSAVVVHTLPCLAGPDVWVKQTLARYRGSLCEIQRRFELLRSRRLRMRRQVDGDDIDLDAYLESHADYSAGLPLSERVYQSQRRAQGELAILLLVDISGSTDSWVRANQRIIDVEREALLLVCLALERLNQPYAVHAFSGEGPKRVTLRTVKDFEEPFAEGVAQRISGLEPEQYTRAGAAVRHATTLLMRQPARNRLLLLLSDGKPNDVDRYEGRYGVEDLRQSVVEAKLQGISPFCLTIDRQAANYLPLVFGMGHYALLTRPELLPTVLLEWLRRLVVT